MVSTHNQSGYSTDASSSLLLQDQVHYPVPHSLDSREPSSSLTFGGKSSHAGAMLSEGKGEKELDVVEMHESAKTGDNDPEVMQRG